MRDDGSIVNRVGYDAETGIYHDRAPTLNVPDLPSLEEAQEAARRLLKPALQV
jgi:hypothetical protein